MLLPSVRGCDGASGSECGKLLGAQSAVMSSWPIFRIITGSSWISPPCWTRIVVWPRTPPRAGLSDVTPRCWVMWRRTFFEVRTAAEVAELPCTPKRLRQHNNWVNMQRDMACGWFLAWGAFEKGRLDRWANVTHTEHALCKAACEGGEEAKGGGAFSLFQYLQCRRVTSYFRWSSHSPIDECIRSFPSSSSSRCTKTVFTLLKGEREGYFNIYCTKWWMKIRKKHHHIAHGAKKIHFSNH